MSRIKITDFDVGDKIGQGGFAEVYRACQRPYKREVVLKILRLDLIKNDPKKAAARFEREAKLIASLEHPHIVPVYFYDVTDDGRAYLVLRYMRGGSLGDLLKIGMPSLAQCERIFRQVASALDYAHSRGIIHRDIKPSNILLDEDGNAYLADFGLARLLEVSFDISPHHTPLVGTPLYASPEQLQDLKLDRRADLYSLGVVIYHTLTGRPPFQATENGIMALIYHHLHDTPPPPSEFNPQLPDTVNGVFARALAKAPADRYPTAAHLVNDVCAALGMQRETQERQRARQAPARIALALMVMLALLGLFFGLAARSNVPTHVIAEFSAPDSAAPPSGLQLGETAGIDAARPTDTELTNARVQTESGFIAYLACAEGDGYLAVIHDEMQRRADLYGLPLRVYNADRDPVRYNAQVEAAWSEGAKALIVCHLSSGTGAEDTLEEAYQAGIPIVHLSSTSFPHSVHIQPVSAETGRTLGEMAGNIANRDFGGTARAVIIYYGATPGGLIIRAAMQDALLQTAPRVEIAADYDVLWENEIPAVIESLRGTEFDMVLVLNQRAVVPLADGLASAGYHSDQVALVGLIADDYTRSYGDNAYFLRGGVEIDIPLIGQAAVDAAVKLMGGGSVPQTIRLPAVTVDFTLDD